MVVQPVRRFHVAGSYLCDDQLLFPTHELQLLPLLPILQAAAQTDRVA